MKNKLIKLGISAALLLGTINNAFSGILYSQKQVQQEVKLEQILEKIEKKYPKKQIEYFSRGFLQFAKEEFVKDSEIEKMIQGLNPNNEKAATDPNYAVDGVNFYSGNTFMIDSKLHHIGDGVKDWMLIKNPEGAVYEKKFILKNIKDMKNPRLGMEVFTADSNNKIYLNGKLVGFTPKMSKGKWGDLMNNYREDSPFLYGELDISKELKEGENTIRIESEKSGIILKSYDDFLMGRLQIAYDKK
ncbi:MAG: hypothetical protein Q8N63_02020 [Nanoarchaeota archaeon]|nr:hypothetical protein [Nanoarchaeota archaeon]